jgi:hypothetical protein
VSDWTLTDISEKVRDIDFAMLLTHTESGEIAGRPMSNNRDVGYDGEFVLLYVGAGAFGRQYRTRPESRALGSRREARHRGSR